MQLIFLFFSFVFGLVIGSFLNCVIYRLEKGESLLGRSYCPHCRRPLRWYDLAPVFSFLWLGGKCRSCGKKISWQYPAVELATGLLFLLIFSAQFPISSDSLNFPSLNLVSVVFLWYVASSLVVIFVYDLKHYLIPDAVLLPAILMTFIYRLIGNWGLGIENYGAAALLAAGFFLAIFLISRGRWMGFGDVKLAILLGLLLGLPDIFAGLFLAFLFGAILGVGMMLTHKAGLKSQMPFAPFLIIGTAVAFFWGSQLISWYMGYFLFT